MQICTLSDLKDKKGTIIDFIKEHLPHIYLEISNIFLNWDNFIEKLLKSEEKRLNYDWGYAFFEKRDEDQLSKHNNMEIHHEMADLQILIDGTEKLLMLPTDTPLLIEDYNKTKDVEKVYSKNVTITYLPGEFAYLFMPYEPHGPCKPYENATKLEKIIFKIKAII